MRSKPVKVKKLRTYKHLPVTEVILEELIEAFKKMKERGVKQDDGFAEYIIFLTVGPYLYKNLPPKVFYALLDEIQVNARSL